MACLPCGGTPTNSPTAYRDLSHALGALPTWNDPLPKANSGVGRNVDIFDRTRTWAYRAIKRYWTDGIEVWEEIVHAHTTAANLNLEKEHRDPLPEKEIHHLSRSIAHWVWTRFTPEQFSTIQSARGKKSGPARSKQTQEKLEVLR